MGFFTVVPARAGVILACEESQTVCKGCSRASGGDPMLTEGYAVLESLFPRERG